MIHVFRSETSKKSTSQGSMEIKCGSSSTVEYQRQNWGVTTKVGVAVDRSSGSPESGLCMIISRWMSNLMASLVASVEWIRCAAFRYGSGFPQPGPLSRKYGPLLRRSILDGGRC